VIRTDLPPPSDAMHVTVSSAAQFVALHRGEAAISVVIVGPMVSNGWRRREMR
jgi:hypothetical protein